MTTADATSADDHASAADPNRTVTLLDYGAGNVRSIRNAITSLGWSITDVIQPTDITNAQRLIFPGVGSFAAAMTNLRNKGFVEPLRDYLKSGKPFFGICIGMQVLFESSAEGEAEGLGIIPGRVERFIHSLPVPHIGWNSLALYRHDSATDSVNEPLANIFTGRTNDKFYFVHSYRVLPNAENSSWIRTVTDYGERFISAVQKGNVLATQFHPEKSSHDGLSVIRSFLEASVSVSGESVSETQRLATDDRNSVDMTQSVQQSQPTELSKRFIACLDVRTNDDGDLVVTKGDQYDVREKPASEGSGKGSVRNLGKPVELARAYYQQGADEITFLNITSFRAEPLADLPLLAVLEETSRNVFVPLCVGGGIRDYTDSDGHSYTALNIAEAYFRSGADKISIGSDAVIAVESFINGGRVRNGTTSIEQISVIYGAQAVVVSVDPRRVWVSQPSDTRHRTVQSVDQRGPNGEEWCWWQCTIKGGREGRDIDVVELCQAVAELGAGEILLNSMDADGQKQGYDWELIELVCNSTSLPVIASSGAGKVEHFSQVFRRTPVQAALAAGIFHRKEVPIADVKQHLKQETIPVRL